MKMYSVGGRKREEMFSKNFEYPFSGQGQTHARLNFFLSITIQHRTVGKDQNSIPCKNTVYTLHRFTGNAKMRSLLGLPWCSFSFIIEEATIFSWC